MDDPLYMWNFVYLCVHVFVHLYLCICSCVMCTCEFALMSMGYRLLHLQICRQSRIKAIFKTSSPTNFYQMISSWSTCTDCNCCKYLSGGSKYFWLEQICFWWKQIYIEWTKWSVLGAAAQIAIAACRKYLSGGSK